MPGAREGAASRGLVGLNLPVEGVAANDSAGQGDAPLEFDAFLFSCHSRRESAFVVAVTALDEGKRLQEWQL